VVTESTNDASRQTLSPPHSPSNCMARESRRHCKRGLLERDRRRCHRLRRQKVPKRALPTSCKCRRRDLKSDHVLDGVGEVFLSRAWADADTLMLPSSSPIDDIIQSAMWMIGEYNFQFQFRTLPQMTSSFSMAKHLWRKAVDKLQAEAIETSWRAAASYFMLTNSNHAESSAAAAMADYDFQQLCRESYG
jgi:hypothetical protein